jgi:hypothetical protein
MSDDELRDLEPRGMKRYVILLCVRRNPLSHHDI